MFFINICFKHELIIVIYSISYTCFSNFVFGTFLKYFLGDIFAGKFLSLSVDQ